MNNMLKNLVIWLVIGAMTMSGALCYGELAARFPEAGGSYVFLREAWGPAWGFLSGWISFFAGFAADLIDGLLDLAAHHVGRAEVGEARGVVAIELHRAVPVLEAAKGELKGILQYKCHMLA